MYWSNRTVLSLRKYHHYFTLENFSKSVSLWFLTGVWVTSLIKSPELLPVFWPTLTMPWSLLFILFPSSPLPVQIPLVTVPSAPITICITLTVTIMFHRVFRPLSRFRYSAFFSLSFNFTLWSAETEKSTIRQVPFFIVWSSGRD